MALVFPFKVDNYSRSSFHQPHFFFRNVMHPSVVRSSSIWRQIRHRKVVATRCWKSPNNSIVSLRSRNAVMPRANQMGAGFPRRWTVRFFRVSIRQGEEHFSWCHFRASYILWPPSVFFQSRRIRSSCRAKSTAERSRAKTGDSLETVRWKNEKKFVGRDESEPGASCKPCVRRVAVRAKFAMRTRFRPYISGPAGGPCGAGEKRFRRFGRATNSPGSRHKTPRAHAARTSAIPEKRYAVCARPRMHTRRYRVIIIESTTSAASPGPEGKRPRSSGPVNADRPPENGNGRFNLFVVIICLTVVMRDCRRTNDQAKRKKITRRNARVRRTRVPATVDDRRGVSATERALNRNTFFTLLPANCVVVSTAPRRKVWETR